MAFPSYSPLQPSILRAPRTPRLPSRGPLAWLLRFTAVDRDRWVSVVCGAGFTLLLWVDWIAA
jgi:hypothetical protein